MQRLQWQEPWSGAQHSQKGMYKVVTTPHHPVNEHPFSLKSGSIAFNLPLLPPTQL
jgi:hypothetical protein